MLEDSLLNFQINECTNEANQHKCRLFNPAEQSDIVIDKEPYFQLILIYLVLTLEGSKRSYYFANKKIESVIADLYLFVHFLFRKPLAIPVFPPNNDML